jgi:hypothetical protein
LVTIEAVPASAHLCTYADQIAVGRTQTISVGVTVESQPVPDVEIQIPAGLRIDRVDPAPGFHIARTGQSVRYRGGPIAAYTCAYFTLGVTAPAQGVFTIGETQRTANGSVVVHTTTNPTGAPDPRFEQVVYAGVKPPASPSTGGASTSPVLYLGLGLVGVAVIVLVGLAIRSWRRNRAYDDEESEDEELAARVEEFKKQARDRGSSS